MRVQNQLCSSYDQDSSIANVSCAWFYSTFSCSNSDITRIKTSVLKPYNALYETFAVYKRHSRIQNICIRKSSGYKSMIIKTSN